MASYKGQITLVKVNDGAEGASGQTLYTWIKYADDAMGTNISDDPTGKSYIGLAYNQTSKEESSNYEDYDWALIKGEDGIPGEDGQDGQTLYTWIKYADDETGLGISDNPGGKLYIGLAYNRESQIESEDPSEYTWALIKGEDGVPGADGRDSQKFRVETSQDEILKFFNQSGSQTGTEGSFTYSPNEFKISIIKLDATNSDYGSKIELKNISDIKLSVFTNSGWIDFNPSEEEASDFLYIDDNLANKTLELNMRGLDSFLSIHQEELEEVAWAQAAKALIKQETILKIRYETQDSEDGYYYADRFIKIRYGMNSDMAKFQLKAEGIYQSIASTKLNFDANGLTVINGGLKIKNKEKEDVLEADVNGNLILKGTVYATNSTFSGEIQASSGTFNGTINAEEGNIGGFKIDKHSITSSDLELYSAHKENGEDIESRIVVKNIEIGTGATIQEYIQLGSSVKIWNPEKSSDEIFIQVLNGNQNAISLDENGTIILGNINDSYIKLDGANQEIFAQKNSNPDYTWKITPEEAVFNNITARGSFKATNFEYGTIQSIGGTLLVRPSSTIKKIDGMIITLENTGSGFSEDDLCIIEDDQEKTQSFYINSVQGNQIILKNSNGVLIELSNSFLGAPIINLGKTGAIGIGINGSNMSKYGIGENSISVVEHNGNGGLNTKIILGKLPDNKASLGVASNTYGLYAENVVLNGSLTTKTMIEPTATYDNTAFSYSGIGTTLGYEGAPSTINMTDKFPDIVSENGSIQTTNRGQILFWAGARGTSKADIEASKFLVDQYGNMYAGSGYFDGTIITNSIIEATEIRTAILTGTGKKDNSKPALIIQDVAEGIYFYNKSNTTPVFTLGVSGFVVNGLQVNLNNTFAIDQKGNIEVTNFKLKNGLQFEEAAISYPSTESKISFASNEDIILKPSSGDGVTIGTQGVYINGNIFYMNEGKPESEYRQAKDEDGNIIGYDLYIF